MAGCQEICYACALFAKAYLGWIDIDYFEIWQMVFDVLLFKRVTHSGGFIYIAYKYSWDKIVHYSERCIVN